MGFRRHKGRGLLGADALRAVRAGRVRGSSVRLDAVNAIHHQNDNHPSTGSRLGTSVGDFSPKPNTKPNTFLMSSLGCSMDDCGVKAPLVQHIMHYETVSSLCFIDLNFI
jgi:hypothetical protein